LVGLNLVGISRSIIEHGLSIDPSVRPKKQKLRKMLDEKTEAAKAKVHRLLEAKFIEPVEYPPIISQKNVDQKLVFGAWMRERVVGCWMQSQKSSKASFLSPTKP
jgi:phage-related minor tail protein